MSTMKIGNILNVNSSNIHWNWLKLIFFKSRKWKWKLPSEGFNDYNLTFKLKFQIYEDESKICQFVLIKTPQNNWKRNWPGFVDCLLCVSCAFNKSWELAYWQETDKYSGEGKKMGEWSWTPDWRSTVTCKGPLFLKPK